MDDGATWSFQNIIAAGGWQGGGGKNISSANTAAQQDPVWEPHLVARGGKLVAYYSDENDYVGYDSTTGVPTLDPDNGTATDPQYQETHGSPSAQVSVPGTRAMLRLAMLPHCLNGVGGAPTTGRRELPGKPFRSRHWPVAAGAAVAHGRTRSDSDSCP